MLFNSLEFVIFLPLVFIIYWFIFGKNVRAQNLFIVFASYFFYGWWDFRFLILIFFSTIVDYSIGKYIAKSENERRRSNALFLSLFTNLGLLFFFKYYNFFLYNFESAFTFFGSPIGVDRLNIILPVGISFYTFQTLSYTIDVYRRKIEPTHDFVSFMAFVSFFPQLVAGPIERASNLLPQFTTNRKFEYSMAANGLQQILWGLTKKIVIADGSAQFANMVFNNHEMHNGSALFLGSFFFALQIYGDFSGYSDIAIGCARLFGFDLMRNFAYPYFSRDIAEFWRRWHISLSTWFRDYLYIPLGGSKVSKALMIRNTFVIFLVSGFWHGANWTFIIWGLLNAIYFLPLLLRNQNRKNLDQVAQNRFLPTPKELFQISTTFLLTLFAWIFFRSENLTQALSYLNGMFSASIVSMPNLEDINGAIKILVWIIIFLVFEWFGRKKMFALEALRGPKIFQWTVYCFLIVLIIFYSGKQQEFIYFQF